MSGFQYQGQKFIREEMKFEIVTIKKNSSEKKKDVCGMISNPLELFTLMQS